MKNPFSRGGGPYGPPLNHHPLIPKTRRPHGPQNAPPPKGPHNAQTPPSQFPNTSRAPLPSPIGPSETELAMTIESRQRFWHSSESVPE